MRVIIAGAGAIGRQVLADLSRSRENEVIVVDLDEARCEHLSEEFDALIIHGDATDPDILEKAQVREAEALVATTGSDPLNTVIATLGHRYEVPTIIAKIKTNDLRGALEEVGASEIIAPTMAAAGRIHAALHGSEKTDIAELVQGGLRLIEIGVGPDAEGDTLGEIGVPDGGLLVAVVRREQAHLARSDLQLEEGDVVLALVESDEAIDGVRDRLDHRSS